MHCRKCGYALWNLTEPRCPECGQGFDLRGYRFTPGTVAFACPHCGHLHGGAGPNHVPSSTEEAVCGGCGRTMQVAAMRVVPLTDDAEAVAADLLPWEQRRDTGFWTAWWRTLSMSLIDPGRLGAMIHERCSFGDAYTFALVGAVIAALVSALVGLFCNLGLLSLAGAAGLGPGPGGTALSWDTALAMLGRLIGIPVAFVWPLVVFAVHGGAAHLALLGARRHGGFRITGLAMLYGCGPGVLAVVPGCGAYIAIPWSFVSSILILMGAQGISGWRASCAVLWLPMVVGVGCCAMCSGAILLGIYFP